MTEAPIRDPTAGKAATASLAGEGAGAADGPSAITALMEAAAKMTAQAILFISIRTMAGRIDSRARGGAGRCCRRIRNSIELASSKFAA